VSSRLADDPAAPEAPATSETPEHFDVIVVGAGISGISAGYHLGERRADRSYLVLEARDDLGGTWDLFRYPGIRSDSDMYTLGFRFYPWSGDQAIADGDAILSYLHDTVQRFGIDRHIRFGHQVRRARWDSERAQWEVEAVERSTGRALRFTCGFLFMCSGYYAYEQGHTPEFEGIERFAGQVVHPQQWTDDIDVAGKRVVVIGSGATAVTLVPALAGIAAHVTMLQRSPSYVVSLPAIDTLARGLHRVLPDAWAHGVVRWRNVLRGTVMYALSRRAPGVVKRLLKRGVRQALGPDYDVDTHFSPRYDPWDQRLCVVPDGDLFEAIASGQASVVTDHIECFTEQGLRLRSGQELPADVVVTATGLQMRLLGGIELWVDGEVIDPAEHVAYKAMMLSDVPNLALTFGYTNASWTLKADLTSEYVCRLLDHMERAGYRQAVPRRHDASVSEVPFVGLSSGYVQRAKSLMPKQGTRAPWRLRQSYLFDLLALRHGAVDDPEMELS